MDELRSRRTPFTTSQLQELELQTLIFNYLSLGMPIPPHLVLSFRRSFSLDYPLYLHPSVSCTRRVEEDPESWRCKRTDGKKWRCSREACGDSKYCERHKHRGKKCIIRNNIQMPSVFTSPASSSSSSYAPPSPPLGNATAAAWLQFENRKENDDGKEHCFVFGADLKLQKPVNVGRQAQNPEVVQHGGFFLGDRSNGSWMMNAREEPATQLSMSISHC